MNGGAHTLVQVPPGVQCFVGEQARRRRAIEEKVVAVFEGWDYEEIIPPLLDYADVFASPDLVARTYSFVGRDGSLLALRPDFTSLLAKIAAGRLAASPLPLRLYYSGEVLRYEEPRAGRHSELYQMGLERLGGSTPGADSEVLAIAAEGLEALGVGEWVLALGHVGIFNGLLAGVPLPAAGWRQLREAVESKDADGVRGAAGALAVEARACQALVRLTRLAGDRAVLPEAAEAFSFSEPAAAAVAELAQVVEALERAGLGARVSLDLGEVRGLDYYTGLVFRIYARGLGYEVGAGGRYDTLLARFGRPAPAVGFMFGLDRLAHLVGQQEQPAAEPAVAEPVSGGDLGAALASARSRRAQGRRVRFDSA